jgi:Effector Associated Constant Component 1
MKLKPVPAVRRVTRDMVTRAATAAVATAPETDAPPASDVRGLIDNATADRLYGWAWDAAYPGRRLKVELRLAGEVVANTIADFVRPDLAKLGVGDGCHAFEFPLTSAWSERKAELTAVAFGVDGTEVPIAMRIRRAAEELSGMPGQLQRVVEGMLAEQQQIRGEIAALREQAGQAPQAVATVQSLATAQEEMAKKLQSLELWLTRLDGTVGAAAARPDAPAKGMVDVWETVLIAVLAGAGCAALAVAVTQYLAG